jgi:hypothetical protein
MFLQIGFVNLHWERINPNFETVPRTQKRDNGQRRFFPQRVVNSLTEIVEHRRAQWILHTGFVLSGDHHCFNYAFDILLRFLKRLLGFMCIFTPFLRPSINLT